MQIITLEIQGMRCGMCEAHINDAIRNAVPVKSVTSSRKKGLSEIRTETEISDDALKKIIGQAGYELKAISRQPY